MSRANLREFWLLDSIKESLDILTAKPSDLPTIHVREVSPEYDAAIEGLVEALKESNVELKKYTSFRAYSGQYTEEKINKNTEVLAAFEKAKAVK